MLPACIPIHTPRIASFRLLLPQNGCSGMSGHPFQVKIEPGATDASKCVAMGTGLLGAKAGVPDSFLVVVYDSFSNRITDAEYTVFTSGLYRLTII